MTSVHDRKYEPSEFQMKYPIYEPDCHHRLRTVV